MEKIYLDHIAGNPVAPEVVAAMQPFLTGFYGNPQSMHVFGEEAKEALDLARQQVAGLINARPDEIYFTSSGTESNNLAIKGLAQANRRKGNHIVVSAVEHLSILNCLKPLKALGFEVTEVPVDTQGRVDPEQVKAALTDQTILVSVQYANSEVGTIQPVKEIAAVVHAHGAVFHTDAVAAAGVIPMDVIADGVDALSLSASQFYGPKGAAALYIKKGTRILAQLDGGIQEEGRRSGTENLLGIAGLGAAAELAKSKLAGRAAHTAALRDRLTAGITAAIGQVVPTGDPHNRLPHHASFCIEFVEGEAMLLTLTMKGIAVSSGSACTSKALKASHVLLAMGVDDATAQGSLVFSLGEETTEKDIDYVLAEFPAIVERLRSMSPLYTKFLKERKM